MYILFTLVFAGLCVGAFGAASTTHYKVVDEHPVLSQAKLLAARRHRAERQAPDPLVNMTVRDNHNYYSSTFKPEDGDSYWFDLPQLYARNDSRVVLSSLSGRSRTIRFQLLPFPFPYYGHILTFIGVGTNGFLNAGTLLHDRLADFQYIAPLQANFEPSNGTMSGIYIYSSDERFTVQWDKVINIDHVDAGVFTFQVSLFPSGDIHFVYRDVPVNVVNISDESHPVRVGVSDAYFQALARRGGIVYGVIRTYHAVDLNLRNVLSHSAIVLSPLPNCIMARSCMECSNVTQFSDFSCGWCQSLNRCSDGIDRHRQEWLQRGCHEDADLSFCTDPASTEVPTATVPPVTSTQPTPTVPPVSMTAPTATVPPVTTTAPTATVPPVTTTAPTATVPPVTSTQPTPTVSLVTTTAPTATVSPVTTTAPTATVPPVTSTQPTPTVSLVTTTAPTATVPPIAAQLSGWQQPGSIVGIFIGILVVIATVILISVCVGVAIYAYRHPASRVGMYMIEARKGRFRTNRIDTYDVKNEKLTTDE